MRRLKRVGEISENDIEAVQELLGRIDSASDELKDIYYVLFDTLNALFESYPQLYKEVEMVVKLPKNEDAENIVKFHNDLHDILGHLSDKTYLNSLINPSGVKDSDGGIE